MNRRIARVVVTCASLLLIGRLASAQTCSPRGLVAWWPGEGSAVDVTGAANVTLKAVSMMPTAGGSPGPVNDAGRSNPSGFFRFDPTLGGYVFNLSTRGLKTGSYQLSIEGPDKPFRYAVAIQIR